jgi:UDP-N-acetylmuramyl pentapeptide phosphotransferase/UDP-N-acetylglucosamine-1-phosphate transferase
MLVAGAFVGGALAAAILWRLLTPTFGLPVFERVNHRGNPIPTAAGLVLAVTALAVEATVTVVDVAGVDVDAASIGPRRLAVLAAVGFCLLGMLDDLAGTGESGGFRGHLRALVAGRLTTGAVKLFGGAALAIVVVAAGTSGRSLGRLVGDAALVALAANLGNLLDRAPGRVTKATLLTFAVLAVATGAGPELAGVALAIGAGAGLLVPDLRERCMLGDAGANVLGAAVGLGVVLACSPSVRLAALVAVAALNLLSEAVSFSRLIERTPPLRALDRLGRRPAAGGPTAGPG